MLIVTDTIYTGQHLSYFMEAFKNLGINCNIATIAIMNWPGLGLAETQKSLENFLGMRIFTGGEYSTPGIHGNSELSGVESPSGSFSLFAKPHPISNYLVRRERISTRRDVEVLAQGLIEWYRKNHFTK